MVNRRKSLEKIFLEKQSFKTAGKRVKDKEQLSTFYLQLLNCVAQCDLSKIFLNFLLSL